MRLDVVNHSGCFNAAMLATVMAKRVEVQEYQARVAPKSSVIELMGHIGLLPWFM